MLLKDLQELSGLLQPLVARKLATTMAEEWAFIQQEVLDPQVGLPGPLGLLGLLGLLHGCRWCCRLGRGCSRVQSLRVGLC
jgi:hypothetical protein